MEYKVNFHPNFEKQMKKLSKDDYELVNIAINRIKENPFVGEEINSSCFDKLKNKYKYLKRELELRCKKWMK